MPLFDNFLELLISKLEYLNLSFDMFPVQLVDQFLSQLETLVLKIFSHYWKHFPFMSRNDDNIYHFLYSVFYFIVFHFFNKTMSGWEACNHLLEFQSHLVPLVLEIFSYYCKYFHLCLEMMSTNTIFYSACFTL